MFNIFKNFPFAQNFVLIILLGLSVVTWTIAVGKIRSFKKILELNAKFQNDFWDCKSWSDARKIADASNCEMANLAKVGFKEFDAYVSKNASVKYSGELSEILDRPLRQYIQYILRGSESGIAVLASTGSG